MKFFMPGIEDSDRAEEAYVERAKEKECAVVPADQRIQAIAFEHSASVTYVAEVGKRRRGYRKVKPKRRADPWPRPEEFESGGVVAAIIEGGDLFYVWELGSSQWANPALVGRASVHRIDLFNGDVLTGSVS